MTPDEVPTSITLELAPWEAGVLTGMLREHMAQQPGLRPLTEPLYDQLIRKVGEAWYRQPHDKEEA